MTECWLPKWSNVLFRAECEGYPTTEVTKNVAANDSYKFDIVMALPSERPYITDIIFTPGIVPYFPEELLVRDNQHAGFADAD